jgi:adenine-specific DNA-methyltransferase
MTPYYQDDWVTLYHGRAEDVLPTITPDSVDVLLTDPPYFQVKDEEWDRQWRERTEFLAWLGQVLDVAAPALRPSASLWMFASPLLTSTVELEVIAPRFHVLNSIRWLKPSGTHNRMDVTALRSYVSAWEGLILAEQRVDAYTTASDALRQQVFAPVGRYIREEREHSGMSRRDVASRLTGYKNVDSANANIFNWELGKNLISERDYESMRAALNGPYLIRPYEHLRREYEDLRREYEDLRRPFRLTHHARSTDVWTFDRVQSIPGRHPCEKPVAMLDHMITTTTKPGALILDPFAGSGSTLRAAKDIGRRAIGIEMDERWCKHAARRLTQEAFDFGGVA